VKEQDEIRVRKGPVHFSIRVLSFPTSRVGSKLVADYARDITPKEELDKLELIRLQQRDMRPRGLGRPSKKDRRELDDFVTYSGWDDDDLFTETDARNDGSEKD
jgi:ribosome-associated heat shock protein Hsp15